ncbi:Rpn family recombination-promoting nuclease/putative transposase [Phormidesmis sp. 146-35]
MKTDSIFYRLFQTFPSIFFELIGQEPSEASAYEFSSVELKQTAFRIDGLFLPIIDSTQPIFFLEVQFQKDPTFYARFFCEIFLYLRLYAPTKPWRAIAVFAKRSLEPTEILPYQSLLELPQVTRLYLNELGDLADSSLGISIIQLVVETKRQTPRRVRQLIEKARSQLADQRLQQEVLDLIETIVLYKLPKISRQEFAEMFSLSDLKKTRYYREVKEEVREEVKEEVKETARQEERLVLTMRLLTRQIGEVNAQRQEQIRQLPSFRVTQLAEALLDFSSEADLDTWLDQTFL